MVNHDDDSCSGVSADAASIMINLRVVTVGVYRITPAVETQTLHKNP